jgi:hypothetical protein
MIEGSDCHDDFKGRNGISGVVRNPFLTTKTNFITRQERIPVGAFEITS